MAAQTWQEIVASAKLDANEVKLLDNLISKIPELKDGGLRQADYSRNMTELKKRQKEYDEAVEYSQRMKAWADNNVPIYESLVENGTIDPEGKPLWKSKVSDLEQQLEEARKQMVAGGTDMTPEEFDKHIRKTVKDLGVGVTTEEIKALIASEASRLSSETVDKKYETWKNDFNSNTLPTTIGLSAQNSLMAIKYERETGEEFTDEKQREFFAFMTKEQDFNPRSAMTKFLQPTIEKKNMEAEVERRVNEKVKTLRSMPGAGGEEWLPSDGKQPVGTIRKMLEVDSVSDDIGAQLNDAVRKASQELRQEVFSR